MPPHLFSRWAEQSLINIKTLSFTSSNKPHVWAIGPLLSWSCSLKPFLWGVKVTQEPGVLKDHYTSSASAAAHIPPRGFSCYHTASSPGDFRLLHHRSPGYNPHRTCAVVSPSRTDGSSGQPQKSPGTWKERCQSVRHFNNCSLNGMRTRRQERSPWNLGTKHPLPKESQSQNNVPGKANKSECLYLFFRTPSYWEKPAMKKKVDTLISNQENPSNQNKKKATLTDLHLEK